MFRTLCPTAGYEWGITNKHFSRIKKKFLKVYEEKNTSGGETVTHGKRFDIKIPEVKIS
jgi:hypothetical protein